MICSFANRVERAIEFANEIHHGQFSTNQPYALPFIVHPIAVLHRIFSWGIRDEDVLVASVLHESMETNRTNLETLFLKFGLKVTTLVDELTFRNKEQSKVEYFQELVDFGSIDGLVIKTADCFVECQERNYSAKYYKKNKILFTGIDMRGDEISRIFGDTVEHEIVCSHFAIKSRTFLVSST